MRLSRLFFAAAFLPIIAFAQSPLITNVPNRTMINLDGEWHAIIDPYEFGLQERFYTNAHAATKTDRVEYDFDSSPTLHVPGDWNSQRDQLLFYEGPIWYRRVFNYTKHSATRTFVYFGAANYKARVYLNGQELGEHEGGFTGFNFEATKILREGENFLVVEVDNTRHPDGIPARNTDWWNYGGLTRDVSLIEVPHVFVQNYMIQLARGSQSEIAGWVQLNGAHGGEPITVSIPEAGIKQTLTADASGRAKFRVSAKLDLWSPEHPKLYGVTIASGSDTVHDQIGFRSIEVRGHELLLNGKPIFLRGIAMHEEAPNRGGRANSEKDAETLFSWLRELGCNYVRLAHYPHNEYEIRLADRLGILVWSEIPVYWDIDWQNPATLANAEGQLRDEIARDRNRAAVIFWSMSNETPIKPERTAFLSTLAQTARQLDDTRLVTSALDRVDHTSEYVRTLSDPLGASLDVLGINEYVGWYEGSVYDADKMQWHSVYDKPIVISEFGADAPFGHHGDKDERWTEEYQANLFQHQLVMVDHIPNLVGLSPWVLVDFRSPRRTLPGIQDYYNRKGLFSNHGQKKEAFYVLQEYYQQKTSSMEKAEAHSVQQRSPK